MSVTIISSDENRRAERSPGPATRARAAAAVGSAHPTSPITHRPTSPPLRASPSPPRAKPHARTAAAAVHKAAQAQRVRQQMLLALAGACWIAASSGAILINKTIMVDLK